MTNAEEIAAVQPPAPREGAIFVQDATLTKKNTIRNMFEDERAYLICEGSRASYFDRAVTPSQEFAHRVADALNAPPPPAPDRLADRWVSQTRFGGTNHPPEEQGNCLQAAVASLLAIPLDEAFDGVAAFTAQDGGGRHWYLAFERWAKDRGLFLWWQEHAIAGMLGIADVVSPDLPGDRHCVIARGRDIVWDPSPRYRERGVEHTFPDEPCFMYLLPLDVGALEGRASVSAPPRPAGEANEYRVVFPSGREAQAPSTNLEHAEGAARYFASEGARLEHRRVSPWVPAAESPAPPAPVEGE